MTTDELAQFLASGGAHALAWQQREPFIAETQRQETERAELERRKRERKALNGGGESSGKTKQWRKDA